MSNFNEFTNVITNTKSIPQEQKNEDFILFSIYEKNSHIFEKFVQDKFSHGHSQAMILAIRKIFITYKARSVQDIKNILNSDKLSKKAGSVAYRGFLNFIEEQSLLDIDLIDRFRRQIKVHNPKGIDKFIPNNEHITTIIKYLKENLDKKFLLIFRFMIETSCRYTEAVEFFKSYEEKYLEIKGDVCCYSNFYIRGKKSSFYLLFTKSLYDELKPYLGVIKECNMENLKRRCQRDENLIALKYTRKYSFTTMMMSEIPLEIADMISGRSQKGNVGITHYLNQKELMLKHYQKVVPIYEELFRN